ncbi:HEAT repeat domain-containing protein [Desulfonatronum sp. SC1]|uniref:HEAT repeat domain-containing protein n=1 Tax=Desulfonatronum sp. SC1 TaxID=2109626 RepID=UPI000D311328|nr:HEAT repeat domain-containing protein [Desulfonatronum sp. SC1]PTN37845.1 hypothetical protein C6366_04765 [Desulfonatronum sp. SC1]
MSRYPSQCPSSFLDPNTPDVSFRDESADLCPEQREELQAALELLDSPELIQRFRGESRLTRLGDPVVPYLLEILASSPWSLRHTGILEAFKQIRPPLAVPMVSSLLEHPEANVRLAAVRTLRWLSVGIEPFIRMLGDDDWRIRRESVFCISSRGGERTLLPLSRALRDEHFQVRSVAANALGRLGFREAAPLLREALRDESQRVKAMAAWSLSRWHDPSNLRPLLDALPHAQGEAKQRMLSLLHQFSSPLATVAMIEACDDPDPDVRAQAAMALGYGGTAATLKRLSALCQFAKKELTHKAAWVTACFNLLPRESLLEALRDGNESIRYFAVCALGYMNLDDAHAQLHFTTRSEATTVKKAAVRSLKRIKSKRPPRCVAGC